MYNNDEVNYYFIYVTIRNLVFDLKRREKNVKFVSLDTREDLSEDVEYKEWYNQEYYDSDEYLKHKVINDWYENDKYLQMLEDANLLDNFSQDKMKVY